MPKHGLAISMVIVIAAFSMLLLSSTQAIAMDNLDQTTAIQVVDSQNGIEFTGHRVTASEVQQMKSTIGVRDPSRNYNQIVNNHGTGLAPPTEAEWDWIANNVIVFDSFLNLSPEDVMSFDISSSPYFPAIGNQGTQGSCAAWASTYYTYGYLEALDNGWSDASSGYAGHLMSPAWTYNMVNGGSDAGSSRYYNMGIISVWGVPNLASMPYDQYDYLSWGTPQAYREAALHRAENIYYLSYAGQSTVDSVKALIQNHVPITFSIDGYELDPAFSDGNYVVSSAEYDSTTTNHAQTIVGFNDAIGDDGDLGAFKIANSWGSGWGNNGYYWLTYSAFMEIGSQLGIYYLSDRLDYQPSILATWHFDTCPTRDVHLEIGLKDSGTTVAYKTPFFNPDPNHNLPPYLSLDITELNSYYSSGVDDFYLNVGSGTSSGTISSFKIELSESGYVPGAPSHVSGQATGLKASTPATVINSFPHYTYCSAAEALDSPYITTHMLADTSTYATWVPVRHHYSFDGDAMQSGDISHLSHSSFKLQIPGPSTIQFDWMASSEPTYDTFSFYVDDIQMDSISGITGWSTKNYSLPSGSHIIEWRYSKDVSISSNDDCGWIDHIVLSGIELDPPILAITSPSEGAFLALSSVTISWTASDPGSGLGYFESSLDGGAWVNEGLATSKSFLGLVDGLHTVAIRAWDNVGNYAISSVHFRVDTVSPNVVIASPVSGGYYSSTVETSWSGIDPSPGSGIASYELQLDGGPWIVVGLSTSYVMTNLNEGSHTVQVRAFDAAGNSGSSTTSFGIDLTNPSVAITSPSVDGRLFNLKSLLLTWTGSDALSGIDHYRIGIDGTWTDIGNINQHELQNLAEGGHTATVMAVDKAGNTNSDSVTFSVDTVAPVIVILTPVANGYYNTSTISTSWLGTDPTPSSGVWFYWTKWDSESWINQSSSTSASMVLSEGAHQFQARAYDKAMNSAIATMNLTVDLSTPSLTITFPLPDGRVFNKSTIIVNWTGSDAISGIDHYKIGVDGTWAILGNVVSSTLDDLQEGRHSVTVIAFDRAGNTKQSFVNFTVDTRAPIVVILNPITGDYHNSTTIQANWSGVDPDPGSGIWFYWTKVDNEEWVNQSASTNVSLTLVEGMHTLRVRVFDRAQNSVSVMVTFTVDLTKPYITIDIPLEGRIFASKDIRINWTGTDNLAGIISYELRVDDGTWSSVGLNVSYLFAGLLDGSHDVWVKATDAASNFNVTQVAFMTDITKPLVYILSPYDGARFKAQEVRTEWYGQDETSQIDHYEVSDNRLDWINVQTNLDYIFSALIDGSHLTYVKAFDRAGNENITSISFVTDVTSPYLAIFSPLDGDLTSLDHATVAWTVYDNTTGLHHIWLKVDNGSEINVTGISTYLLSSLTEGPHTIHLNAWDMVSNEQEKAVSILIDLTAPSITIHTPKDGAYLNSSSINVNFNATDQLTGVKDVQVKLDDGDWIDLSLATEHTFYDLTDLQHTIQVVAKDNVDNARIANVSFIIDTIAPNIVTYSPTAENVMPDENIVVAFTEAMDQENIVFTIVPEVIGALGFSGSSVTFLPSTNLSYATVYNVSVSGTDLAGNSLIGNELMWNFTTMALLLN